MDSKDIIERADAALEGVTDGPWSQAHQRARNGMFSTQVFPVAEPSNEIATISWHVVPTQVGYTTDRDENARFIAASRQLVPELRDALAAERANVEALEAENKRLREALVHLDGAYDCSDVVNAALNGEPK